VGASIQEAFFSKRYRASNLSRLRVLRVVDFLVGKNIEVVTQILLM